MKRSILFGGLLSLSILVNASNIEKIVGQWVTIDDKTGEKRSIVKIFKATDGLYYGKIEHLYEEKYKDAVCIPCEGADKDKPIVGLLIIRGMQYKNGVLQGGKVLDPENGKFYYGKISYKEKNNLLELRGSIDKRGLLGRSQYWIKRDNKTSR